MERQMAETIEIHVPRAGIGDELTEALLAHGLNAELVEGDAVFLLACLVVVTSAAAARKPTASEGKAIRSAIAGYIAMPNSPAAKDNRVVTISISSLDGRYASARLNSKSAGPADIVLHFSMGTWFVQEFGSSLGCDAAPKAVLADLKVGCTPPGATAWISDCGLLRPHPTSLILTCADANYWLAALKWHGWGHASAMAIGDAHANDCNPNCAAGQFSAYPVKVTATGLRRCGSARYYSRVTIVYAGARPTGIAKRDVHTLGC